MASSVPEGADFLKSLEGTHQILRGQEQLACCLAQTLTKLCTETEELVKRCTRLQPKVEEYVEEITDLTEEPNMLHNTTVVLNCLSPSRQVFEKDRGTSPNLVAVLPGSVNSDVAEDPEGHPYSTTSNGGDSPKPTALNNGLMRFRSGATVFSRDLANSCVMRQRLSEFANGLEMKKGSDDCVFVHPEELKDGVRKNLANGTYDPCQFYKNTGLAQAIARTTAFEVTSIALLVISSLWIAIAMDNNDAEALHESDLVFQVAAHLFCACFLAEAMVRILAFKSIRYAVKDFWCMFDTLLVAFLIFETWILGTVTAIAGDDITGGQVKTVIVFRILRLMRLMRVLRLVRLLRFVPQLMVIVRGLGIALRAVACVLILLLIIIYAGAIVTRGLFEGSQFGDEWFSSVLTSMGTLMLECTLSGSRGTELMRQAYVEHPLYAFLLFLFVLLANVTLMGILAGILVQTVRTVAEVENEEKTVRDLVKTIEYIWNTVLENDADGDGQISVSELRALVSMRGMARIMQTLDVDVEGLVSVSDFIFDQKNGRLGREDFLQLLLNLRGSKKATVKDHIETRKFIHSEIQDVARQEKSCCSENSTATPSLRPATPAM